MFFRKNRKKDFVELLSVRRKKELEFMKEEIRYERKLIISLGPKAKEYLKCGGASGLL